jgi:hypothetical protein
VSTRISSTRAILAIAAMVFGALLLAAIPLYLIFMALTGPESVDLPGTWVILTSVLGMGLVAVGAALRE